MTVKRFAVVALAMSTLVVGSRAAAPPSSGTIEFIAHDIEPKFPGGYSVAAVDVNHDGKLDVIGVSQRVQEMAWYENPSWERHVMAEGYAGIVNFAASDIDGDGIPEVAFQSSFAMQAANSLGINWIAHANGDPRQPWKVEKIDQFPTSHHVGWADLDGDGRKELINAPLIGEKSLAPTYDQDRASLFWYSSKDWKRHVIATDIPGIIHRVRPVKWDSGARDQLLVASFEGIALYRASGSGDAMNFEKQLLSPGHVEKAPRLGTSDVAVGTQRGKRFLASVEPWHGNEIVVYALNGSKWERTVIFSGMTEGHEVALADLNGDGLDDVIAGDRSSRSPAVHVMYAPADPKGEWTHQVLDEGKMAASGCVTADLNGDKRPDIVCIGASTANLKWYENVGKK